MTRRSTPLLSLVLVIAAVTHAAAGRGDRDVLRDVTTQLAGYTQFTVFDSVEAEVTAGRVTLRGWVTVPFKREDVVRRVGRVDGVVGVDDAIVVLPESQADDQLRYRIARAIYGHDAFLPLAAAAPPPIRIVVDRGQVILVGTVADDGARALATRLAATADGRVIAVRDELRTGADAHLEGRPGLDPA
jgi:osmotically-inducible protein OsmY